MLKKMLFTILLVVSALMHLGAQKQAVTVDDLYKDYSFRSKGVYGINSMNDGTHYTVLEDGKKINMYEYATGKLVNTLLDVEKAGNKNIKSIQGYTFSPDESKILVFTNYKSVYRHSYTADYYVYDFNSRELNPLSEKGAQQMAIFSPDGNMVAFVRNNNIYIKKFLYNSESEVTTDGKYNEIINGIPDWVYEEEFGFNCAMEWSPQSDELAFIRFDESGVKEFSFPIYQASYPKMDDYALYPGSYTFKYPKAGEANSKVSVHVFNLKNRTTKTMDTGGEGDYYLPRIRWTNQQGRLAIIKLNRHQNQLELLSANSSSTVANVLLTVRNKAYVDESVLDNIVFLPDGKHFIYVGEDDGYNHIYLHAMNGIRVRQLTKGNWDVTGFEGYDDKSKLVYFTSAQDSPMRRNVYSVGIDGKKITKLTTGDGIHSPRFSSGYKYFINTFSNTNTPPVFSVIDNKGKLVRVIEDNSELKAKVAGYDISPKSFFTFTTSEGTTLNGWMVKPLNFDESKQYPVLMIQYSGPNSQQVMDRWGIDWEQVLAAQGYVVACVDPRGTGARGEEFRKCTYMKLGKYESDDQIEAARYLGSLSYIDKSRIGIWGWSYGGFMSSLCLSKSNLFKVGIAVAPVTNWRFYDTVYTERYMRTPQENPSGYDDNSPITHAANLQGRLFLIHGSADDNVHYQNQIEYADKLIISGKQFDMFTYPNRNHSIYGGPVRHHLYTMMVDYLKTNL